MTNKMPDRANPSLSAYVGEEAIKRELLKRIEVAKQRRQPLPHLLLCGPHEMGKSTLGYAIAREMEVNLKVVAAADIKSAGFLAAVLTNLEEADLLVLEDIERLNE